MKARRWIARGVIAALGAWTLQAMAQRAPATPAKPPAAPAAGGAVATVGGVAISRAEFEARAGQAFTDLRSRLDRSIGAEVRDALRRQVLESLIRRQLLVLEARRTGVTVPEREVEDVVRREPIFNPGGRFDAARYQAAKTSDPARFQAAFQAVRDQLAGLKLSERFEAEALAGQDEVREAVRHDLTTASLDLFQLPQREFGEPAQEPRESDIVAAYHAHPERHQRGERMELGVVFVNLPALGDAERLSPDATAAWNERMRAQADSLLALVRAGGPLPDRVDSLGGARAVTVDSRRFPPYWLGSGADEDAIRRAPAGTWLAQPVRATEGWLLVRVDAYSPAGTAPLHAVAMDIRRALRRERREHAGEIEMRQMYAAVRDSLRGPGLQVRYAWVDTSRVDLGTPSAVTLEEYYRAHQADYSSFDSRGGRIVVRPLAEVRASVESRWAAEEKLRRAQHTMDAIEKAWRQDKRDPRAERLAQVREPQPVPLGGIVDTGEVARAVSDSLWGRPTPLTVGRVAWARGVAAWRVTRHVPEVTPLEFQLRDVLREVVAVRRREIEEQGARTLYERDPGAFSGGVQQHYGYMVIPLPEPELIALTRADVERWYRQHLDDYSAPEMVRARHILVSPVDATPGADADARRRAEDLVRRIRAGEPFFDLVQRYSDDAPTKGLGGDLGFFARGVLLEGFERAAFAMRVGELSAPVRTEAGYHVIEVTDRLEQLVTPLALCYSTVASDCAVARSDTVCAQRADSLLRSLRTPAQARAVAASSGYAVRPARHTPGAPARMPDFQPMHDMLDRARPGQLLPRPVRSRDQGYWIAWLDSLSSGGSPTWPEAREEAIAHYRAGAGERGLGAKRAECDSLLALGWTLDSLATMWGGWTRVERLAPGQEIRAFPFSVAALDSMLFSREATATGPGDRGWVVQPQGVARVRIRGWQPPEERDLAEATDRRMREVFQRRIDERMAGLQQRFRVVIHDTRLRQTPLRRAGGD